MLKTYFENANVDILYEITNFMAVFGLTIASNY